MRNIYISEIGINHNGSLETAKELIDKSVEMDAMLLNSKKDN